jgi:putative oxidoreductase
MMTLGLLTGLAATAFVGMMVVAMRTDHRGKGYFVFRGGWEYTLLVAMVSVSVAAMGPGKWSLDRVWGLRLDGTGWAVISAVVGCALALGLVATCHRPNRAA